MKKRWAECSIFKPVTSHSLLFICQEESVMKTHKDLEVWKLSIELTVMVYKLTSSFPKTEMFGIVDEMRRAAVSIPSNIAEGAARQTDKEFVQFLFIAQGSCAELETQLILSEKLKFINDSSADIKDNLTQIMKLIGGLIRSVRRKVISNE